MARDDTFKSDIVEEQRLHVRLTFTESVLGTCPGDEDIYRRFIGTKAPDAKTVDEEVAALGVDAVVDKGMTIFPKLPDGTPFIYAYQVKGFFKDACGGLRRISGTKSSGLKAYKQVIDKLIMVDSLYYSGEGGLQAERDRSIIPYQDYGTLTELQRPLRTSGPAGEKVALAISEQIRAGAKIEFIVRTMDKAHQDCVIEWLNYGRDNGLSQWRNSGHGRFLWEQLSSAGDVLGGNYARYAR